MFSGKKPYCLHFLDLIWIQETYFTEDSDTSYFVTGLLVTFGGMWRWRRVAVARVFALVVRCRVMLLLLYSRVGKNRDTGGSPRREPGQAAPPTTQRFSLAIKFSRCGEPMTYTDLLGLGLIHLWYFQLNN